MSSDNGIYVLETTKGNGFEYRVRELQCIENVDWDNRKHCISADDKVRIKNARQMWKGCEVFKTKALAFMEASRIYDNIMTDDFGLLEYGICVIKINKEF